MLLLSPENLKRYAEEVEARTGISQIIIEKDYWVCWILDLLFTGKYSKVLTFKGGTSLSKAYKVIDRFSEDIDLTIDKSVLALDPDKSLEEADLGTKQKKKRGDQFDDSVEAFIKQELAPWLHGAIKERLAGGAGDETVRLRFAEDDPQNLFFDYPRLQSVGENPYIIRSVRLEFGARGERSPQYALRIQSYIEEVLPELFAAETPVTIQVLGIERTFWEKVTILHSVACRPEGKSLQPRFSRHYYDVFRLADDPSFISRALADTALLASVVANKRTYFYESWDWYDSAQRGKMRLVPSIDRQRELADDYTAMQEMMFSDKLPDFSEVILALKNLEAKINEI